MLTVGTVSYADLTLVLPAAGRCATAPTTDPWSSVTPPSWWATEWGLPEVPGPHWIRLDVEGPLTFERMLVTFVERADGSADVEVRGRGFGAGDRSERHAPLNAAVWLDVRSLVHAMVTATPAAFQLPQAGGVCSVGSTRFRLESGSNGGATGFQRDGLVRDSREWEAVDQVLQAAGLSLDR
ncbi:MAG: hypothetical protein KC621_12185 [Myxococcales bacterium]|nr:hypothetical protein [Myxococcales bacterium]